MIRGQPLAIILLEKHIKIFDRWSFTYICVHLSLGFIKIYKYLCMILCVFSEPFFFFSGGTLKNEEN